MDRSLAQKGIIELVNRFETHFDSYKDQNYKEARLRGEFINPFFEYLGWDVYNKNNAAEAYREVIQEDSLKIEDTLKAPDYSFRLAGGKRLFFVEAKKPSVSVIESIQPAYQVRRYGWSAKHPISVVTDFEEFAIYDCTAKPNPNDKPSVARIKYLTFLDYLREFDFIWDTFSREQVLRGSFDKFVHSDKQKQGTATVDKDFLESLDRWRTYLAVNLSWNNKLLGEEEINFAVQQLIDRIIFLRIAEDRKIEPYGSLKSVLSYGDYYSSLFSLFRRADEKYNSGLFDFKRDRISETIKVDNKVIKTIIDELYYPKCPYEFSVMPIEILGSVYEQFLGKVIRITPAHHAKVEEKPEVRKAGGVYYTPQYIVDYIVKNTIGKLIEGKAPNEISSIKIVDPACGSGSFLIGALQFLFEYHRNYYNTKPSQPKGRKDTPLTPDGHLTTSEKKRILLNNIYGVDLDANAVEVTKLSLLLKCLEGETDASINNQLKLFNDRVLPSLDNNIKNGNSLIDTDYYDNHLDFDEDKKIKPFNWQSAFSSIFEHGGFDIVIGNPPFIQLSSYSQTTEDEKTYLLGKYKSSMGRLNTFGFFTKKGIDLLKDERWLGFILPNTLISQDYYEGLRDMILKSCKIDTIVNFEKLPFKDAVVENIILILQKNKSYNERTNTRTSIITVDEYKSFNELKTVKQSSFEESPKHSFNVNIKHSDKELIGRLTSENERLGSFLEVNQAIALKSDRSLWVSRVKEGDNYKPLLVGGKNIHRYYLEWDGTYLKYDIKGIHSCKREDIFLSKEKIFFRRVADRLIATLDTHMFYGLHTLVVMNLKTNTKENIRYFLGLFNSNLLTYYYKTVFASTKTVFSEIGARQVKELPIKRIDPKIKTERLSHDKIVELVDQLLKFNEGKNEMQLPNDIIQVENKIEYCDRKINELVYQLYGLTTEEVGIVENSIL